MTSIGLFSKSTQQTKRESWIFDNVEIEIDTWPWIPPFVEIEASNEESLKRTAQLLDLDLNNMKHGSVETAYQAVYEVSDEEVDAWSDISFIPVPEWLAKKIKSAK
ncbi:MAG: hypothetical protein NVSMB46_02880 [Candidatus Saccharimonadales bacterium]